MRNGHNESSCETEPASAGSKLYFRQTKIKLSDDNLPCHRWWRKLLPSRIFNSIIYLGDEREKEKVTIVGNLCTALDVLAENVEVNKANIGDIISVSNAGSYGYSLSPQLFSSHEAPEQLMRT